MADYIDSSNISVNGHTGVTHILLSDTEDGACSHDMKLLPVLAKVTALKILQGVRVYEDHAGKIDISDKDLASLGIAREDW